MNLEIYAQAAYYQEVPQPDGSDPAWREILVGPKEHHSSSNFSTPASTLSSASHPSSFGMSRMPTPSPTFNPSPACSRKGLDNISVRSAPPLCRSSSALLGSTSGSPTALRHRRNFSNAVSAQPPRPYKLTTSFSTSSIFSRSPPMPRPQSLYVPFKGCVDSVPEPGRAARDILNALSYAPTHESFSPETRQMALDQERSGPLGCGDWTKSQNQNSRSSWSYSPKLPCIPQSPKSQLRAKSSSMAALQTDQMSPKIIRPRPCYPPNAIPNRPPPPYAEAVQKLSHSFSTTDISSSPVPLDVFKMNLVSARERVAASDFIPIYSPTNPLNHAENVALLVTHPPVIHPPPDIVANSPSPSAFGRNLSSPRGYPH
jgi:hypothetical protein